MTVGNYFSVLTGINAIQFSTDTCKKYGIEDKVYNRQDFYHKFRSSEIWNTKIAILDTKGRIILNDIIQTLFTITLK